MNRVFASVGVKRFNFALHKKATTENLQSGQSRFWTVNFKKSACVQFTTQTIAIFKKVVVFCIVTTFFCTVLKKRVYFVQTGVQCK